jgi:hypothetical protein
MSRGHLFNVDDHSVVEHTNRLEKMSRTALPNAVRGTLNGLAFDTKKNTMPKSAAKAFTQRQANFFKGTSKVVMARGSNVNNMSSLIGFVGGDQNQAVDDLEAQENGGIIGGRAFIPVQEARTGKSNNRMVAKRNRLKNLKNVVNVSDSRGKTKGQRFIQSAIHAGEGGILLTDNALLRVRKLKRVSKNKWKIKTDLLYTYKAGRKVKPKKATHFMRKASNETMKNAPRIFEKEFERQLKKLR